MNDGESGGLIALLQRYKELKWREGESGIILGKKYRSWQIGGNEVGFAEYCLALVDTISYS